MLHNIIIGENEAGQRLDRFLRKYLKHTPLSDIYKLIRKKEVRVNGKGARENMRLDTGDVIEFRYDFTPLEAPAVKMAGRDFSIVFEDENLLVVDKPPGLILHPDISHGEDTLVDQVIYYLYESGSFNPGDEKTFRPAAVNRLDLNTGGLVIFAKNNRSLQALNEMIRGRLVEKRYLSIVKGNFEGEREIKAYLIKDRDNNTVSISENFTDGAKEIHTKIVPIKSSNGYSLVEVELITGRSHQIRAQLAAMGHPIIGDVKYGDRMENKRFRESFGLSHQFLFAYKLQFLEGAEGLEYLKELKLKMHMDSNYRKIIKHMFDMSLE